MQQKWAQNFNSKNFKVNADKIRWWKSSDPSDWLTWLWRIYLYFICWLVAHFKQLYQNITASGFCFGFKCEVLLVFVGFLVRKIKHFGASACGSSHFLQQLTKHFTNSSTPLWLFQLHCPHLIVTVGTREEEPGSWKNNLELLLSSNGGWWNISGQERFIDDILSSPGRRR